MNSYQANFSTAPTIGRIVIGLAVAMAMPATSQANEPAVFGPQIRVVGPGSSAGSISMISSVHSGDTTANTIAALRQVYGELQATQQPLEPDFAKVLFDNLWDLYAE